jgi:hypothetical protein
MLHVQDGKAAPLHVRSLAHVQPLWKTRIRCTPYAHELYTVMSLARRVTEAWSYQQTGEETIAFCFAGFTMSLSNGGENLLRPKDVSPQDIESLEGASNGRYANCRQVHIFPIMSGGWHCVTLDLLGMPRACSCCSASRSVNEAACPHTDNVSEGAPRRWVICSRLLRGTENSRLKMQRCGMAEK